LLSDIAATVALKVATWPEALAVKSANPVVVGSRTDAWA
jgi:hypothetical protein